MARRDFWISVRTASRLHAPQPIVDAPQLDAGEIERILRGANLWLTPDVVAGFDEKDFSFLPEAEQTRLAKLVTEFRQEASNVSPTTPMPNDALERALPLFRDIAQRSASTATRTPRLIASESRSSRSCNPTGRRKSRSSGSTRDWTTRATRLSGSGCFSPKRFPRTTRTS